MLYDVVSLFTKTQIKEACEIIRKRLENDKTLKKRTNLNVDDIMELLKFVLETTYFRFEGEIYQQKFGVAMGSPVSPIVVNLYMEDLEQKIIATALICGRCNLPGTHGKGKEITTTHEHCRPHREHHFHAGR